MMNNRLNEIRSTVSKLSLQEQWIFATACAEHVAPVFRILAAKSSVSIFESALRDVWSAAMSNGNLVGGLRASIARIPEADIDDSHRPEYYATLALGVLEHAVDAMVGTRSLDSVDLACCQAMDIYSSFDGISLGSPTVIVNPNKPVLPGHLESAEVIAQKEALAMMLQETGTFIGERVRDHARRASRTIEPVVTRFVRGGRAAFAST